MAAVSGKFIFFGGRLLLFNAAAAVIIFWFLLGKNLWVDAGFNLFLGPLELKAGAVVVLKVYDPNYPVVSRVIISMILPAVSAFIVAGG
ncbi:MAG: hypothetical protein PF545_00130 [Elusimicrobia bacterium]|nr:hypothetical protein [Elusimicrobiota bacterium]